MGKKIDQLDLYGSYDSDKIKADIIEVSKNSGTSTDPIYAPDGSRQIRLDDLAAKLKLIAGYVGQNGLTLTGDNFELGGSLIKNTTLDLASYDLSIKDGNFKIVKTADVDVGISLYNNATVFKGGLIFDKVRAITSFYGPNPIGYLHMDALRRGGIRGSSPAAVLHISGATGGVGDGPLKIDSATLVSIPEIGLIENDGASLYYTNNSGARTGLAGLTDLASYLPLSGGTLTGNLNGVTPTELGYLSGVTSNIQNQINNINSGLSWKVAVRVATTANITLSGTQTIDGIAVIAGDRVLVKNQTTGSQNGIYVVASGSWSRAADASTGGSGSTGVLGMTVNIEEGSANSDTIFICTTDGPITIGTTSLVFAKASSTTYTGSNGITLTGNNFTLDNSYFSGELSLSAGVATLSNSAVIGKTLTGFSSGAGTVSSSDSILSALQKLNGNDALKAALSGATFTGPVNFSGTTNSGLTVNSLTTTQRDALVSPTAGTIIYNSISGRYDFYTGSGWRNHVRLDGDTMTGNLLWSVNSTIGTSGANTFAIQTNATSALSFDTSQKGTFANTVELTTLSITNGTSYFPAFSAASANALLFGSNWTILTVSSVTTLDFGSTVNIRTSSVSGSGTTGLNLTKSGTVSFTSGTGAAVTIPTNFAPTTGAANYSALQITTTWNQTSTASGTIRGIYYNPTITNILGLHYCLEATSGDLMIAGTTAYKFNMSGTPTTAMSASGTTLTIGSGFSTTNINTSAITLGNSGASPTLSPALTTSGMSISSSAGAGTILSVVRTGTTNTVSGTFTMLSVQGLYSTATTGTGTFAGISLSSGVSFSGSANQTFTYLDINPSSFVVSSANGLVYGIRSRLNSATGTVYGIYSDGTAPSLFGGPLILPSYTVTSANTLAATGGKVEGAIAYINNESGGKVLAFFDGTNWLRVTDRAIIS